MRLEFLFVALVGCGGTINSADGGVDAGSNDAVVKSDVIITGGPCPTSAPMNASPCSDINLICEYGTSWALLCNTVAACEPDHTWQVQSTSCANDVCPQSMPTAGDDCNVAASCDYPTGHCICVTSCGGPPPQDAGEHWACNVAPAGCPYPRPDLGTACATEGEMCAYDVGCCGGEDLTCSGGIWVGKAAGLCP